MNKLHKKLIIALSLPLVLLGCGSTPASNYYLLSAQAQQTPSGNSPAVGVGPIEIPQYLNRHAMVFNRDGNRLHIASFERWAEPLDSSILRVVRQNLASMLNTQDVQAFPWSKSSRPEYGIAVTILNLDANNDSAELVAEWHLSRPQSEETLMRRIDTLQVNLPAGEVSAAEVAAAYSELLYQLSGKIAAEIAADVTSRSDTAAAP
ncbi:MAG: putative lipoprotein YmbA [Halioglobus sp.]|jgi:uncharacterized lipoprotein YmbA